MYLAPQTASDINYKETLRPLRKGLVLQLLGFMFDFRVFWGNSFWFDFRLVGWLVVVVEKGLRARFAIFRVFFFREFWGKVLEKTETSGAFFNSTLSIKFAICFFFVVVWRKSFLSIAIGVMFRVVGKKRVEEKRGGCVCCEGSFRGRWPFLINTHEKRWEKWNYFWEFFEEGKYENKSSLGKWTWWNEVTYRTKHAERKRWKPKHEEMAKTLNYKLHFSPEWRMVQLKGEKRGKLWVK